MMGSLEDDGRGRLEPVNCAGSAFAEFVSPVIKSAESAAVIPVSS